MKPMLLAWTVNTILVSLDAKIVGGMWCGAVRCDLDCTFLITSNTQFCCNTLHKMEWRWKRTSHSTCLPNLIMIIELILANRYESRESEKKVVAKITYVPGIIADLYIERKKMETYCVHRHKVNNCNKQRKQ